MSVKIVDVYSDNLEQTINEIMDLVEQYPIIGVDTEFPGSFHDPVFIAALSNKLPLSQLVQSYQKFKVNIDNMKLIQLGLSLSNDKGDHPAQADAYQFNFCFDLNNDLNNEKSIDLLRQHNIDFERFRTQGINPKYFSYQLMQSGLLCNPSITWILFHGSYDIGYFVKSATLHDLPLSSSEFIYLYQKLFPNIIDLKVALKWDSSLQNLMIQNQVERRGESHQAGSDALATVDIFITKGARMVRWESRGKIYEFEE
ncbi:CAF1_family ribonuclease [Hexamita inflata]|uniref:poly(A)-specific ribonuclease n=1 Tax=Hexamita inflata TaxID=28002 RepID=A0AA86QWC4_9EUKA|nr:CAF1 family ribonuclease [Hexamita inflata]